MDTVQGKKLVRGLMSGPGLVHIANASIGYDKELFRIGELNFNAGEIVSVLGQNGIGKTTFLRSIAGLQELIAGNISVQGMSISRIGNKHRARLLACVLTDRPDSRLTVLDTVRLGRFPWLGTLGLRSKEDDKAVSRALEATDTLDFVHAYLHELSDGERQKVMIAKALAQDAHVLLLDEPMAYLDIANRLMISNLLERIAEEEDKCIIMSTHDLQLSIRMSDRLIVLSADSIWSGSVNDIRNTEVLAAAFGVKGLRIDQSGILQFK